MVLARLDVKAQPLSVVECGSLVPNLVGVSVSEKKNENKMRAMKTTQCPTSGEPITDESLRQLGDQLVSGDASPTTVPMERSTRRQYALRVLLLGSRGPQSHSLELAEEAPRQEQTRAIL